MYRVTSTATVLLAAMLVGCLGADTGRPVGGSCSSDQDCDRRLLCVYGRCRAECSFDQDCPPGASCVSSSDNPDVRVCTLPDEGCDRPGDCPPPLQCEEETGLCRNTCFDSPSFEDHEAQCGEGRYCLDGLCVEVPPGCPEDLSEWPQWHLDEDGDGYGGPAGQSVSCEAPPGHVADSTDCDDTDPMVHPDAPERCNGADDDCDGEVDEDGTDPFPWYLDADSDGYGDGAVQILSCDPPAGYVVDGTDCDDDDPSVHPGAPEGCNGIDEDCSFVADDGPVEVMCPPGPAVGETDCVDASCVVVSCVDGFASCDGDPSTGCETPLGTTDDCGWCGDGCAVGEICASGECLLSGTDEWVVTVGGSQVDQCTVVASESAVTTSVCSIQSGAMCGGVLHASAGGNDLCVVVFEPDGSERHGMAVPGSGGGDLATGLAVVGDTAIVTGEFDGDLDWGGIPIVTAGARDLFVCGYDVVTGTPAFAIPYGGAEEDSAGGVAVDPLGRLLVGAGFSGSLSLGGTTVTTTALRDAFVLTLDPAAAHLSHHHFPGEGHDGARAIAVGPGGVVAVAGAFQNDLTMGASLLSAVRQEDAFLGLIDSGGTVTWAVDAGGAQVDEAEAVVVTPGGDVVVAGWFQKTVSFGGPDRTAVGGVDGFVARYDGSGAWLWDHTIGAGGEDKALAVTLGPGEEVVVAGHFAKTVDLGRGAHTSEGGTDIFLLELDGDGTPLWDAVYGGTADDSAVAVDSEGGYLTVAGSFSNDVAFSTRTVVSAGQTDGFIVRMRAPP